MAAHTTQKRNIGSRSAKGTKAQHKAIAGTANPLAHIDNVLPELRNKLYELLLVSELPLMILDYSPGSQVTKCKAYHYTLQARNGLNMCSIDKSVATAIMRTHKLFHTEASGIFYGKNVIVFEHGDVLDAFMEQIGERSKHIADLRLFYGNTAEIRMAASYALLSLPVMTSLKKPTLGFAQLYMSEDSGVNIREQHERELRRTIAAFVKRAGGMAERREIFETIELREEKTEAPSDTGRSYLSRMQPWGEKTFLAQTLADIEERLIIQKVLLPKPVIVDAVVDDEVAGVGGSHVVSPAVME